MKNGHAALKLLALLLTLLMTICAPPAPADISGGANGVANGAASGGTSVNAYSGAYVGAAYASSASSGAVYDLETTGIAVVYTLADMFGALGAAGPGDIVIIGGTGFDASHEVFTVPAGATLIFGPDNHQSTMLLENTAITNYGTIFQQGHIFVNHLTRIDNFGYGHYYINKNWVHGDTGALEWSKYSGMIQYIKNDGSAITFAELAPDSVIIFGLMAEFNKLSILSPDLINAKSGIFDLFTYPGYEFIGWSASKYGNAPDSNYAPAVIYEFEPPDNMALFLFAQWAPRTDISYNVHYYHDASTDIIHPSKIVQNQTMATTVMELAVDIPGYVADAPSKGLTLDASDNEIIFYYTPRNDILVTFNPTGGSAADPPEKLVTFDSPYGALAVTSRTGYYFDGWFTAETGGTQVTPLTMVTDPADHVLYAHWTEVGDNGGGGGNGGSPTPEPSATPTPTPTPSPSTSAPRPPGSSPRVSPTPTTTPQNTGIIDDETPSGPPTDIFISDHVAYIIGYEDATVRPEQDISRAEVATVFFRLLTDDMRSANWTSGNSFFDVAPDSWYNTAVSVIANLGVIKGYPDGSFQPDADITRGELAAIASRFSLLMQINGEFEIGFTDIKGHWAEDDINRAAAVGWVRGYPDMTFRPDQPITRAEFITLTNSVLKRAPESVDDLLAGQMIIWVDNMDVNSWYYLAIQEASNSHAYRYKRGQVVPGRLFEYEYWTAMKPNPNWLQLETIWKTKYGA